MLRYFISKYWRWGRQQAENQQYPSRYKYDSTSKNADIHHIVAAIKEIEHKYDRENYKHNARHKWDRLWEVLGVVGLWAAAAVGVAAIWVGNHDATQQRETTREAFTSVQRAYITVSDPARTDTFFETWVSWQYDPVILNVGSTQTKAFTLAELGPGNARQLGIALSGVIPGKTIPQRARKEICVADALHHPPDPDILLEIDYIEKFHRIVGPKERVKIPEVAMRTINSIGSKYNKETDTITATWNNFYFIGIATYNDVFPGTDLHRTKYCYRSVGVQAGGNGRLGGPLVEQCPYWNCADQECDEDRKRFDKAAASVAPQCQ